MLHRDVNKAPAIDFHSSTFFFSCYSLFSNGVTSEQLVSHNDLPRCLRWLQDPFNFLFFFSFFLHVVFSFPPFVPFAAAAIFLELSVVDFSLLFKSFFSFSPAPWNTFLRSPSFSTSPTLSSPATSGRHLTFPASGNLGDMTFPGFVLSLFFFLFLSLVK